MAAKRAFYGVDSYFRDSWEDACDCLGAALDEFLSSHATLLVKPDAVASGRVEPTLDWLLDQGATIVAAERCLLTPHVIRALWQYQWNKATRDRRDLADILMPATESLLLVVRRETTDEVPYTIELSHAKGPADPAERRPGELRYSLGNENYLLNFVHTTDEPADMVRELGILVDGPTRRSVYRSVVERVDDRDRARRQAEDLARQVPRQDFDLGRRLARLAEAARAQPPSPGREAFLATLDAVESGRSHDWRALCEQAESAGIEVDRWTRIVVGTHLMTAAEPGREPILDGVTREDWLGAGAELPGGNHDRRGHLTPR
jgi:nucleoside diphosphate kinase